MKIQMDDVIVNYQPKFFTNNTTEEYHEIISPVNDRYKLPLHLWVITSYLTTQKHTIVDFETYPRIDLTYMSP